MKFLIDYWEKCHSVKEPDSFELDEISKYDREVLFENLDICIYKENDFFGFDFFLSNELFLDIKKANKDLNAFVEFLCKVVDGCSVKITSPLSGETVYATSSYATQLVNFIRFYDSGEVFYLVQNHQSFAGLLFPKRKLYICFSGGSVKGYILYLMNIIYNKNDIFLNSIKKKIKKSVLVVSCPRPWHYYYNSLSGFLALENFFRQSGVVSNFDVVSVAGGNFFDLKKVSFNSAGNCSVVKDGQLFKIESCMHFIVGCSFESLTLKDHDFLSKTLREIVGKPVVNREKIKFWVGITGQKRSWIEQEEGIVEMVNLLVNKFGEGLEVVFDGWTAPNNPTTNDKRQTESDNKVVDAIVSKLDDSVVVKNLVGKCSQEKIYEAQSCDFFIANHASGSIHVANFANLPGLSHLNNSMPRKHHIHYKTTEVKKELVKDVLDGGKKGHHVSYHIDVEDFINEFKVFFNSLYVEDLKCMRLR